MRQVLTGASIRQELGVLGEGHLVMPVCPATGPAIRVVGRRRIREATAIAGRGAALPTGCQILANRRLMRVPLLTAAWHR